MAGERPADWSPLAGSDPVPGTRWDVASLAAYFEQAGAAVTACRTSLEGIAAEDSLQSGRSIDAIRAEATDLVRDLGEAVQRFRTTAEALNAFRPVLEEQQEATLRALRDAQDAEADLTAARSRTTDLTSRPPLATPVAADVLAADLTAARTAEADAQARLDAARRRSDAAREEWERAAVRAAEAVEAATAGDALRDRWYDHRTLRNVTGALGEVAWGAGPDIVGGGVQLVAWLVPTSAGDAWVRRFTRWLDSTHDSLQAGWGTDTSSDAFRGTWVGGTIALLVVPGLGAARAARYGTKGAKGAAALEDADDVADLKASLHDLYVSSLPWTDPPLEGDDLTGYGYLQGPAYVPGPLGDAYAPGIVGSFGKDATGRKEQDIAEVLVAQGDRVDVRYQPAWIRDVKNPDATVRENGKDNGTPTEFKTLDPQDGVLGKNTVPAALDTIEKQLAGWGGGNGIVDGRHVGMTEQQARAAVDESIRKAVRYGGSWRLADEYTFLLADGRTLVIDVEDFATRESVG